MKVKITDRAPEGVLVDVSGSEVKKSGRHSMALSLSEVQLAAFVDLLARKLQKIRAGRAVPPAPDGTKPDDQGRHP